MKETYNEQSWGRFKELMQKLTKRLAATSIKADLFDDRLTKAEEELDEINDITTGINLLRGTRNFTAGSGTKTQGSFPDGFNLSTYGVISLGDDGFAVLTQNNTTTSTSYSVSSLFSLQAEETITIFGEVRFNAVGSGNPNVLTFISLNTGDSVTEQTNITASSLGLDNTKVGNWQSFKWYTTAKTATVKAFVRFLAEQNVHISFRKLGVYQGKISHPEWSASPFDVLQKGDAESGNISFPIRVDQGGTGATSLKGAQDVLGISSINDYTTGINLLRGTRDWTAGVKDSQSTNGKLDGFMLEGLPNVKQDEAGFGVLSSSGSRVRARISAIPVSELVGHEYITASFDFRFTTSSTTFDDTNDYFGVFGMGIGSTAKNITSPANVLLSNFLTSKTKTSNEWIRAYCYFKIDKSLITDEILYLGGFLNLQSTNVEIRLMDIQLGKINDPIWSPAPADLSLEPVNDITTGINLARQTRDIIAGTQKLGSYICSDGFYIQGSVIFSKDDQGYGVAYCNAEQRSIWTSNVKDGKAGEWYTFAFEVKFDSVALTDSWNLSNISVRTQDWTTTVQTTSTNVGDLKKRVGTLEAGKWYQVISYILLDADVKDNELFYGYTSISRDLIALGVSYRKAGFYKGRIENPEWSASPFDVLQKGDAESGSISFPIRLDQGGTGSTSLKGAQDVLGISSINDCTTGINLIRGSRDFHLGTEIWKSPLYIDGFSISPVGNAATTFYKDNEGFTVLRIAQSGLSADSVKAVFSPAILSPEIGETYTYCFEAMVENIDDLTSDLIGAFQAVNDAGTNAHSIDITFANAGITKAEAKSGVWYKFIGYLTISKSEAIALRATSRLARNGAVNFRKPCLYKGKINNPIYGVAPVDIALEPVDDITTDINLMRGTRDFTTGATRMFSNVGTSQQYQDGFLTNMPSGSVSKYLDAEGFTVLHLNRSGVESPISYGVYSNAFEVDTESPYTISFEVMIDDVDAHDYPIIFTWCLYQETTGGEVERIQYLDVNKTLLGLTNAESGKWYKIIFNPSFTADIDSTKKRYMCVVFDDYKNGSINFRKPLVYKGKINKPIWSPAPADLSLEPGSDITTGINLLRGTRDFTIGSIVGKANHRIDGWNNSNNFDFYKDEEGFTVGHKTNSGLSADAGHVLESSLVSGISSGDLLTISGDVMIDNIELKDGGDVYITVDWFTHDTTVRITYTNCSKATLGITDIKSGEWKQFAFTLEVPVQVGTDGYMGLRLSLQRNGSINYRKICVYRGRIAHPEWSASPFDVVSSYDWDNGSPQLLGKTEEIPPNADLNSYIKAGTYSCTSSANAITLKNKPSEIPAGFKLYVNYSAGLSRYKIQRIVAFGEQQTELIRYDSTDNGTEWTNWRQTINNKSVPSLFDAVGGGISDFNSIQNGFYTWVPASKNSPVASSYGVVFQFSYPVSDNLWIYQLAFTTANPPVFYMRSYIKTAWSNWQKLTTTTVASSPGMVEGPSVETYPAESLEKDSQIETLESRIKSLEKTLIDNGLMLADDQSL